MTTNDEAKRSDDANSKAPRPKLPFFSYAAYAKIITDHLRASNVAVLEGLSDDEVSSIESSYNFSFPSDLRSILQQGLPVSPAFPNWRSSSPQQLQILLSLPIYSLLRRVSQRKLWHPSWGPEPNDTKRAMGLARKLLANAPVLVPIYRHCYIPTSPNLPGNPVFYIDHDGEFRLRSIDLSGFFREAEFVSQDSGLGNPAWAGKEARKIEFWSELTDSHVDTHAWWWWGNCGDPDVGRLGECLGDVYWTLRDGGWREAEIREMMLVKDGGDNQKQKWGSDEDAESVRNNIDGTVWNVGVLSLVLLRGGWTRDDVVYSLGLAGDEGNSWLESHQQPTDD